MKKIKITYWVSTSIFVLMMSMSGFSYLFLDTMTIEFTRLGFPQYFKVELAVAKLLGAVLLIIPLKNNLLKEWAYAGFSIVLMSAFIAHLASGDGAGTSAPLVVLCLAALSYWSYHKLLSVQSFIDTTDEINTHEVKLTAQD